MYHIHTTYAFVVSTVTTGEKNSIITLFTRDFGMIRARAQSVRSHSSKLRYALQEYSCVEISLVKGKDMWKITNARPLYNLYFELQNSYGVCVPLLRILSLIRRLLPEEGCEEFVFDDFFSICEKSVRGNYNETSLVTIEWLFVLRMLSALGYARAESLGEVCTQQIDWSSKYLDSISFKKNDAISYINSALQASQL